MTVDLNDFMDGMEEDAVQAANDYDGVGLTELGQKALEIMTEISDLEAQADAKKKNYERIMRYAIPEALAVAGISEFGFATGTGNARVKMATKVLGSLSKSPNEDEAVAYLEEQGFSGAIKSVLQVDFTEDERDQADAMAQQIHELNDRYPTVARVIHPQTLMAFVRAKLVDDPSFDYEKVGTTAVPMAKFTQRS
jgi:hypothetical protein